jgi:hypothetical protein
MSLQQVLAPAQQSLALLQAPTWLKALVEQEPSKTPA